MPGALMVWEMKLCLSVWVCGLSVVVRTQTLCSNTSVPSKESSRVGVYEAGVLPFFLLPFTSLSQWPHSAIV